MSRRIKPEHVLAKQAEQSEMIVFDEASDFNWLDAPPLKSRKLPVDNNIRRKRELPGHPRSEHQRSMTEDKWKKFLELAANGLKRKHILAQLKLTKETFEAYLITSVAAAKQLREADSVWLRRSWSLDEIEQMLIKITLGRTINTAGTELGHDEQRIGAFLHLVRKDPRIKDMYDLARELQSEAWMDENIDIADNRGEDTFIDHKGMRKTDHGVIQRDRLRVETRQWTMGAMNRKRFGDHKHIDHGGELQVNHAVLLSHARKRLENARKPFTIEGQSKEVVTG